MTLVYEHIAPEFLKPNVGVMFIDKQKNIHVRYKLYDDNNKVQIDEKTVGDVLGDQKLLNLETFILMAPQDFSMQHGDIKWIDEWAESFKGQLNESQRFLIHSSIFEADFYQHQNTRKAGDVFAYIKQISENVIEDSKEGFIVLKSLKNRREHWVFNERLDYDEKCSVDAPYALSFLLGEFLDETVLLDGTDYKIKQSEKILVREKGVNYLSYPAYKVLETLDNFLRAASKRPVDWSKLNILRFHDYKGTVRINQASINYTPVVITTEMEPRMFASMHGGEARNIIEIPSYAQKHPIHLEKISIKNIKGSVVLAPFGISNIWVPKLDSLEIDNVLDSVIIESFVLRGATVSSLFLLSFSNIHGGLIIRKKAFSDVSLPSLRDISMRQIGTKIMIDAQVFDFGTTVLENFQFEKNTNNVEIADLMIRMLKALAVIENRGFPSPVVGRTPIISGFVPTPTPSPSPASIMPDTHSKNLQPVKNPAPTAYFQENLYHEDYNRAHILPYKPLPNKQCAKCQKCQRRPVETEQIGLLTVLLGVFGALAYLQVRRIRNHNVLHGN